MVTLVLGGARSGKSLYAEQLATASNASVIYIATAEANDSEMDTRIKKHQSRRPQHWQTAEEPIKLANIIQQYNQPNNCLLVDCLTLWLSNILFDSKGNIQQQQFDTETQALFTLLPSFTGQLILVSNEVGQGIIAMDKMTRRFTDEAGLLHQKMATLSHRVIFVTAGLAQVLK